MQTDRFRTLVDARGPFASVYFEDSHNTEDARAQLEIKWRALRDQLTADGADDDLTQGLEQAIFEVPPAVGLSGRALVANREGVLIDEHLIRPPVTQVVRVSDLPYLVPLVEHGRDLAAFVVAAVDHTGADVTLRAGETADTETVDGSGYPVHKAVGAESPGYGDPQSRAEEQAKRNLRAVAEHLTAKVDETDADPVFVIGEARSRADLLAELPERISSRVVELQVGARGSGIDDSDIEHAIATEFEHRRLSVLGTTAERFNEGRGRADELAVEGLAAVCAALRDGNVETLVLGDVGDATVVTDAQLTAVAPDPDTLSALGAAPEKTIRADEALPITAIGVGASLVRIDERIEPADGIAALLRYSPTRST